MDFVNFMRTVEQFAYELMAWVLFYPLTMVKTIVQPLAMLDYVAREDDKDPDIAYASAMRPALFLLLSLTIGALIVPLAPQEIAALSASRLGRAISESWMALVLYRMCVFTAFPITGALIYEQFTPGEVDRTTLRRPFSQQCYLFAPFALTVSPCLILAARGVVAAGLFILLAHVWILWSETLYFRRQAGFGWIVSCMAAFAVLLAGWLTMIAAGLLVA